MKTFCEFDSCEFTPNGIFICKFWVRHFFNNDLIKFRISDSDLEIDFDFILEKIDEFLDFLDLKLSHYQKKRLKIVLYSQIYEFFI